MPGKFVDSNIVLYLASADKRKSEISDTLLQAGCIASVQVLNEIANVLRRKYRFSWAEVRVFLEMFRAASAMVDLQVETHMLGLNVAERYGFSIYDSMIVAAALQASCDTLYSEDLQHGQSIDGLLTIINPYL
jgi:predicted nucleic acid-binding protein